MKTNLDSIFKTDSDCEKEGVLFALPNGVKFKLRRFGGTNVQKVNSAMAEYHAPHVKRIENGQLSPEEAHLIDCKVFAKSCLVSWEGIKDETGEDLPYSFENAVALFNRLPELFSRLFNYAKDYTSFKEDLGNSSPATLSGSTNGEAN